MRKRELDEETPPRRRPRYIQCVDEFCGADDCPNCRPANFRAGVFIADLEANKPPWKTEKKPKPARPKL